VRTTFVTGAGLGRFAIPDVDFGADVVDDVDVAGFVVPGNAPVGSWATISKEEKKLERGRTITREINRLFITVLLKIEEFLFVRG
jgi:hypothetical protein